MSWQKSPKSDFNVIRAINYGLSTVQFNQITYFLRSCDTLNFTRAAETCHISQPSLSAAIKKLELELGGPLFDRNGHVISLTPLGESMRVHLSRIEQAREAASIAASEIVETESNLLNIGFMCTLSPRLLLTAITSFGSESKESQLLIHNVSESKTLDLIVSGALDGIIMAHSEDLSDRFQTRHLTEEKMLLAMHASHPLSDNKSVSLSELQGLNYIDRLRCEYRDRFFNELGDRDLNVKVVLRSEREDLVIDSVSKAVGVTIMPESAAKHAGLKTCELSELPIVRKISVVTVKERELNTPVRSFIEHVVAAYNPCSA